MRFVPIFMSVAFVSSVIRLPKVYQFDVDITSFDLKHFQIGTHQQELELSFSLSNPDIVILDSLCKRTYGDCPRYCDHPSFCEIYCNPICCTSTSLRERQCNRFSGQYKHKSTKFQVLHEFWRSYADDSVGVYAKDVMFLTAHNGDVLKLEHQTFALSVVISIVNLVAHDIFVPLYTLGLGRTPNKESFVERLYYDNHIPLPIVTVTFDGMLHGTHQLVFGEYHNQYCGEWNRFDVVSETDWMIDAKGVAFFDYRYQAGFKLSITESPILRMPHHVLQSFLDRGLLVIKKGYGITYYVQPNPTQNYTFYWNLTNGFTLQLEDFLLFNDKILFKETYIRPMDPNPDNLQWILNGYTFYKYCVAFDYGRNQIAFATCKRCIS